MTSTGIVMMHRSEEGAGQYGKYARGATAAANRSLPALQFIDAVPYDGRGPFTICDYGAADGGTSTRLFSEAIRNVRKLHGDHTEIMIIYDDQVNNDFQSLFKRVLGLLPVDECLPRENVFAFASATNFYTQCCPSSSVHFGHSNFATMIISKRPCPLRDVVFCLLSEDPEERRRYAEQGAQDWSTFLEMRAKELVPGGFLMVTVPAVDNEGSFSGHTPTVKCKLYTVLAKIWKGLQEEGMITEEEFQAPVTPSHLMMESEFRAPFEDVSSAAYRLGLQLKSCDIRHLEEYDFDHWIQEQGLDRSAPESARRYAQAFVNSTRIWSDCIFRDGLDHSRSNTDDIMNMFFKRLEDIIYQDPANHGKNNVVATLCITKNKL